MIPIFCSQLNMLFCLLKPLPWFNWKRTGIVLNCKIQAKIKSFLFFEISLSIVTFYRYLAISTHTESLQLWDTEHYTPYQSFTRYRTYVRCCVADPDPNPDPDPHVFGPPGSGSFYHLAKIVRKTLTPTILCLFDFLSLKNDVNVASKSNKQKKLY
jgi:hypothetical protein